MELNRNHYFVLGLVLLALGIQFRLVETYVLTPEFTAYLAEQTEHPVAAVNAAAASVSPDSKPLLNVKTQFKPPQWLGYSLLSIGAVLILHSMSMPKPAG